MVFLSRFVPPRSRGRFRRRRIETTSIVIRLNAPLPITNPPDDILNKPDLRLPLHSPLFWPNLIKSILSFHPPRSKYLSNSSESFLLSLLHINNSSNSIRFLFYKKRCVLSSSISIRLEFSKTVYIYIHIISTDRSLDQQTVADFHHLFSSVSNVDQTSADAILTHCPRPPSPPTLLLPLSLSPSDNFTVYFSVKLASQGKSVPM